MLDMGSIQAAFTALKAAKELGTSALELRDFNQAAAAISQINAQLLKAHDSLFELQGAMYEMREENHRLRDEVRDLKAAQDLHSMYEAFELKQGNFVYRLKDSPPDRQYCCQPCLSVRKQEVILRRVEDRIAGVVYYECSECKTKRYSTEPARPMPSLTDRLA